MRLAIYHPWIYLKSGLERTILEIKRRSRHDWVIYTGHYDAEGTYPELKGMDVKTLKAVSVRRQYGKVIRAGHIIATTKIEDPRIEALVVSCDGLGSFINFANPRLPAICICFTPLRAVYDPEYRLRMLSRNTIKRTAQVLVERAYRLIDKRAWRRYRHVFCISQEVRRRVLTASLCDPSIVSVAYPGINAEDRIVSDRREPFFFLPGRIMWTKNIELAIEAFLLFRQRSDVPFMLKIAGMVDQKSQAYYDKLRALAKGDDAIDFILSPTDAEMRDYYRHCYGVLLTAFNEDLGITPMEAGTCGKPVIAVNRGGPREIVVDGETGLLVEPNPETFSRAMDELVKNPDEALRMGLSNFERSNLYTWDAYVESLDAYFDRLALSSSQAQ